MNAIQTHFGPQRKVFALMNESPDLPIQPISCNELMEFLEAVKRAKGKLSKGNAQRYKSAAIKFRMINGFPPFTADEQTSFKRWLKGLHNQVSESLRHGNMDASDSGKRHLKVEEYQSLLNDIVSIESGLSRKTLTELPLFLTLSWNLCARSDTTASIHSTHLEWEGDCLKVGIAKSKRNYGTSAVYYHVFANPLSPAICPILALAIHAAVHRDVLSQQRPLFRETSAQNRGTSNWFSHICTERNLQGLGCHSIRKGAITFASNGTPESVPFGSIQVRARWNSSGPNGTLYRRYVRFEAAGDQFIGRILAGLPVQSSDFSAMPPRFNRDFIDSPRMKALIASTFGDLCSPSLIRISTYLLASLVFHHNWLQATLFKSHRLWSSSFGRISCEVLEELSTYLESSSSASARGIPVSVRLLEKQAETDKKVSALSGTVEEIGLAVSEIKEFLPMTQAAAGQFVGQKQMEAITNVVTSAFESILENRIPSLLATAPEEEKNLEGFPSFTWGGQIRAVPSDFVLIRAGGLCSDLWDLWWVGEVWESTPICPYKTLILKFRKDVVDAYKLRGEKHELASKSMTEIKKVVQWFLDQVALIEDENFQEQMTQLKAINPWTNRDRAQTLSTACWRTIWDRTQNIIKNARGRSRKRAGQTENQVPSKKRKHDNFRLGLRAIYERIMSLDAEAVDSNNT
jgi:hypothetical protein